MQNRIRVSVIMPCFNAEKYIAEAIESILEQTYRELQLIVIDDGSTDKSKEIVVEYAKKDKRIRLLCNEKNKGQVYTRNRGFLECETEYIALMDADDVAPTYRIEREIEFLDAHPDIGAVGGEYQLLSEDGRILGKSKIRAFNEKDVKVHLFFRNVLPNSSMMLRTEIVKKNEIVYREEDRGSAIEDYRFWSDFSAYAPIANLSCVLLQYRIVGTGISHESRNNRLALRNRTFDDIHREMFEKNGFDLGGGDGDIFLSMFRDEFCCRSLKEWIIAFHCFKCINQQAAIMNKPYKKEMKKMSLYFMVLFTKSLLKCSVKFIHTKKDKNR